VGFSAVPSSLSLGDVVLDMDSRRVTLQGTDVMLRTKEFDLLARLVGEPDAAVSGEALMVDVWDENWVGSTTLNVQVASLRSKVGRGGTTARIPTIRTLRGYGFRLDHPTRCRASKAGGR
jgi:DNA-binding response OmpR family regulator